MSFTIESDSESDSDSEENKIVEGEVYIQLNLYFNRDKKKYIVPNVNDLDLVEPTALRELENKYSYSYVDDVETDINHLNLGGNKKNKGGSSTKIRKSFKYIKNLIKKK